MNIDELKQDYDDAFAAEQQAFEDLKEAVVWLEKCRLATLKNLMEYTNAM